MSNIEDIENVRSFLFKLKDGTELKLVEKENYDKLVERIKELEEENRIFALEGSRVKLKLYIEKNYIPVQKVKDKIEHYKELQNNYIKKYDEVNDILQGMVNVLIELLEDK